MLPGARPAPQYCDPEAQPQPQQSPPTMSDDAAATLTKAATHTSHRCHLARKIASRGSANGTDEKGDALPGHAKEERKASPKEASLPLHLMPFTNAETRLAGSPRM
ncbi:hypothetical protein NDU88_008170 [Pleurodeles waltl]|uniref:Uncharacterized protein n=1 Tax=Pleurodeles waltl TaxID=8319 RepID=A0AAV7PS43_PLEWA|nr:hypothetical protein NDU88_008170 [Pleurodeles waltl]